jgi:hypothetical protein
MFTIQDRPSAQKNFLPNFWNSNVTQKGVFTASVSSMEVSFKPTESSGSNFLQEKETPQNFF